MRSSEEIIERLRAMIAIIYKQPEKFGSANRVDTSLWCFHMTLAIALEREESFHNVLRRMTKGPLPFPDEYRAKHPNASDSAVSDYVVKQWFAVSKQLYLENSDVM